MHNMQKKAKRKQPIVTAATSEYANTIWSASSASSRVGLTRPAAPLALLSFAQRKALFLVPSLPLSPPTASHVTKPSVTTRTGSTRVVSSTALPNCGATRLKVQTHTVSTISAAAAASRKQPLESSAPSEENFVPLNISNILNADSARDLDSRDFRGADEQFPVTVEKLASSGLTRRNTTFVSSQSRKISESRFSLVPLFSQQQQQQQLARSENTFSLSGSPKRVPQKPSIQP
ncbi:hypothetical protein HK100_011752 [Physocladia obscura]|uniref:Uncharacterized protein n=1 Tax=Physocladia obscura TaxID=109957 RepID=A0AAD5T0R7_9FUNG|nr:hypothetical protein HK100_011752 [Physocladia obscura]